MRVSHRTVEAHKKALLVRSGCRNTAQLLRWAIETGLIDIADGKHKGGASTP
jgi:DNA-binding NarL/FixJ family response regulator